MRRCFRCARPLPEWMYRKDRMKYQRPVNKGRSCTCRTCSSKQLYTQEGKLVRRNFETHKFEIKEVKVTKINWIRIFLGRI